MWFFIDTGSHQHFDGYTNIDGNANGDLDPDTDLVTDIHAHTYANGNTYANNNSYANANANATAPNPGFSGGNILADWETSLWIGKHDTWWPDPQTCCA